MAAVNDVRMVTCSLCGRERQLNAWCTCPTAVERQAEVAEWERRWVAGVPVGPLLPSDASLAGWPPRPTRTPPPADLARRPGVLRTRR